MYYSKNGSPDQRNRVESPETNTGSYSQLICDKGGKNIQWRKTVSFLNGGGETAATCERKKSRFY